LGRALAEWRGRIDELIVHAELTELPTRESVFARLEVTESVYLAGRTRIGAVLRDTSSDATEVRENVNEFLFELRQTYEAANEVFQRAAS
jgi:hypothetical protein